MPAYRPAGIDQLRTFYGLSGQLLAGGYLKFYEAGTTNPADVFGDKALTTNNGSQIDLDASGRPEHDIWADTAQSYFIELFDSDDVKQGEIEDVEVPGGTGQTIPVPSPGEVVSGDGTNFITWDISGLLLPDPAGHANHYLQTDATAIFWDAGPEDAEIPALPITVGADSTVLGAAGSDFEQRLYGSDSVAGGGGKSVTDSVTFATAFKTGTVPKVEIQLTGSGATTTNNALPKHSITAVSATGFTVTFSTYTGGTSTDDFPGANLTGTINYNWTARGVVADPT
jgi:hypothetical protein